MSRFLKLVYNEQIKIYIRKSTWIMYILLAAIILGLGLIANFFGDLDAQNYDEDNWRETLQEENDSITKSNEQWMEDMGEEDDALTEITDSEIAKNNYYLENDIQPASYDAWQFVQENVMLLSIVSLLTIIVAAGIVAHEFRWGSIKLLLIRPISRSSILLSKYISVLLFALFTLLFVLIFSWIVGAILFGVNGFNPHVVLSQGGGEYAYVSQIGEIVSGYGYKLVTLVMMATFAFMISSVFRNSTLAIGTAIFLMFTGTTIVGFFAEYSWAKYILFANTELKPYSVGDAPLEGMTLGFSITVLLVYYAIFMIVSWWVFTKRDVAGQ